MRPQLALRALAPSALALRALAPSAPAPSAPAPRAPAPRAPAPRAPASTPSRSGIQRLVVKVTTSALAALLLSVPAAYADTVALKNGDRITGAVSQLAGGKLTIKTTYGGDIAIAWDQVVTVKFDKPLVLAVETKVGKKVELKKTQITAIDRTPSGLAVTTISGTENMAETSVTTVRTTEAEQAYESSLRPGILHAWTGGANLSVALARGNSETTTIGAGMTAVRATPTNKTSIYYNTLYTHDGIANATTANLTNAGLRYDHNLIPRLFAFGTLDFNTNALQDLDLRTIAGGGIGWHAVAKPTQMLDLLGGVVYTHESYSPQATAVPPVPAEVNSFAALDLGEQYTRKFGPNSSVTEQGFIFPDLSDTSQYRATVNAALSTKIRSFLSWQVAFSDIYVTNPPSGLKDNDVIFTTGVGFNFTRK